MTIRKLLRESGRTARLWIVAPVYLDTVSYIRLRTEILANLGTPSDPVSSPDLDIRFIVVDDSAGVDSEIAQLPELGVRVIAPPFNLGHQRALVLALRTIAPEVSDDDLVVTLDADGEDRPEDLSLLLQELLRTEGTGGQIVLARRTNRRVTLTFRLMYLAFAAAFRTLTGTVVKTGNFAAYRGWVVRRLLPHPHFDLCYSASLISLNLGIRYVPCPRGTRYAGRSRMSYEKLIRHGISMLMPFADRIAVRALVASFIVFSSAALAALWLGFSAALGLRPPPPEWMVSTLLTIIAFSVFSLSYFIVLFALYAQSQAAALRDIEQPSRQRI